MHVAHDEDVIVDFCSGGVSVSFNNIRAPRPPTFPTKQVGTSYFEENSPTFPTFHQFYENVIYI